MRIFEITGDDENEIYNKLRHIYFILNSTNQVSSPDVKMLRNNAIKELYTDSVNLNYWVISSERISKIFSEIKKII